jgi:protein-S-isoprenylcysteine O-methyltransferase Ste14
MAWRTFLLGSGVMGTVFVLGPVTMVALNTAWAWPRWENGTGHVLGAILIVIGLGVAFYCARLFARVGGGTPVPTEPPTRLVVSGLYRYSRNPIYVADACILFGLFLHRGELALLLYVCLFTAVAHAWIVWWEEPRLRQRFGDEYAAYTRRVPRWIGLPCRPLQ